MWGRRFRLPTRVMFYRRRLPHWHPDLTEATFLFVTWRLAGSIPRACLPQPATGAPRSAGRAFLVLDREVDKAAFGPVCLRDARVASVVANVLLYGEHGRNFYQLRAWVIMPNHVHVLLLPKASLPVIMRWLKGSTARQANLILGRTGEAFWQDESFDHRVRDEAELDRLVHYVEHNPVSAGLAANTHAWHWARALAKCRNSRSALWAPACSVHTRVNALLRVFTPPSFSAGTPTAPGDTRCGPPPAALRGAASAPSHEESSPADR